MLRGTMTERQVQRIRGPQGSDEMRMMRGEDQPNVDVQVAAQPGWDQYDGERLRQMRMLLGIPGNMPTPPEAIQLLSEVANISPEISMKAQQVAQAIMARMMPPPPQGPPGMPNALPPQPMRPGMPPGGAQPPMPVPQGVHP